MTKFIETRTGAINVAAIVEIYSREIPASRKAADGARWETVIEYRTAEGEHGTAIALAADIELEAIGAQIVPAQPGYFAIGLDPDDPSSTWRVPVIAWRVPATGSSGDPICVDPISGPYAILTPDGTVIEEFGAIFPNETAYRTAALEELRERQEREIAKPTAA